MCASNSLRTSAMSSLRDFIDDPRFNRTFVLPPDASTGRTKPFTIKYADYGYRNEADPAEEHVFLFYPPLMASRLIHIAKDDLAKRHKVRIIAPDRPGFGGTDGADATSRLGLWSAAIPALLEHLSISHVSIGCHSAGVVYALDILLHYPKILDPSNPYLAIAAPWILPSHTNATAMAILRCLLAGIIGQTDKLAKLIKNYLGPAIASSIGFSMSVSSLVMPSPSSRVVPTAAATSVVAEPDTFNIKFEERVTDAILDIMYEEGIDGMSPEAVLLMQKQDRKGNGWGDWGDYDFLVPKLAEVVQSQSQRLQVDVFYAEDDSVIGDPGSKGPGWFDDCWKAEHRGTSIDYSMVTVKGADHNTIWDLKWDTVHRVFERISHSSVARPGPPASPE